MKAVGRHPRADQATCERERMQHIRKFRLGVRLGAAIRSPGVAYTLEVQVALRVNSGSDSHDATALRVEPIPQQLR